jgi:signal peptidase I
MSDKEIEVEQEKESKPLGPPKGVFREYFESLVVTLVMAIFGMTFILQAVTVPTGSMQNTILIGDYLLVNKFIFAPGGKPIPFLPQRDIRQGDIIVFKYPGFPDNQRKVKDEGGVP